MRKADPLSVCVAWSRFPWSLVAHRGSSRGGLGSQSEYARSNHIIRHAQGKLDKSRSSEEKRGCLNTERRFVGFITEMKPFVIRSSFIRIVIIWEHSCSWEKSTLRRHSLFGPRVLYVGYENCKFKVSDPVFRKSFYLAFIFRSFSLVERTAADFIRVVMG